MAKVNTSIVFTAKGSSKRLSENRPRHVGI